MVSRAQDRVGKNCVKDVNKKNYMRSGNETGLYLDCAGGYTNLCVG